MFMLSQRVLITGRTYYRGTYINEILRYMVWLIIT